MMSISQQMHFLKKEIKQIEEQYNKARSYSAPLTAQREEIDNLFGERLRVYREIQRTLLCISKGGQQLTLV